MPTTSIRAVCLGLLLATYVACSKKDKQPGPSVEPWFKSPPGVSANLCTAPSRGLGPRKLAIGIYHQNRADPEAMKKQVEILRSYLAVYDVELFARWPQSRAVSSAPFLSSPRDIEKALRRAGLDPTSASDRASLEAGRELIEPTRAFLDEHARPPMDRLQLIFVDRILSDDHPLRFHLGEPAALTISPYLSEEAGGAELAGLLRTNNFAPTIFIELETITRLGELQAAWLILHEFGHAFGLDHRDTAGTPMEIPDNAPCVAPFRGDQLEKMDVALEAVADR